MATQTWNPSDKTANVVLSGGNLGATGSDTNFGTTRCTLYRSTGKWYFETVLSPLSSGQVFLGFGNSAMTITTSDNVGSSGISAGARDNGSSSNSGTTLVNALGVTWANGDRMNVAIDYDAGKIWIGKNGTWTASGAPASGTNPWSTFTANTSMAPAVSVRNSATTVTVNFGGSSFTDSVPTGFSAYQKDAYTLSLAAGSYAITGKATLFAVGHFYSLVCTAGSYALTGAAATMKKAMHLTLAAGSYAITGKAATLGRAVHMTLAAGSYVLSGKAASLTRAFRMVASAGSYVLTGIALIASDIPAGRQVIRAANYVLQKLRATDPTLDQ